MSAQKNRNRLEDIERRLMVGENVSLPDRIILLGMGSDKAGRIQRVSETVIYEALAAKNRSGKA